MQDEQQHDAQGEQRRGGEGDLSDLLNELRILLPGAQTLTAFLFLLPFNSGFAEIVQAEKIVFLATFFFSMASLVLLSAPAIQHRVMRPLQDRERFKRTADRIMMAGALSLALAFILGTNLVISEVFGYIAGIAACALVSVLIIGMWWWLPLHLKRSKAI
jgi:Na+/proline symporter